MTGFDILLLCLIGYIISFIITYKNMGRPYDSGEWIGLILLSLLHFILMVLTIILLGALVYALIQVNWIEFFTKKLF